MTRSTFARFESWRHSLSFGNARTWSLAILTIVLLGVTYMGQVSQTAMIGQRVHEKQDRLTRLTQENAQLESDIATLLSPDRVEARAKSMGLHLARPEQIKYLTVKDYPAEPIQAPAIASELPSTPPAATAANVFEYWQDLMARLSLTGSPRAAEATTNP